MARAPMPNCVSLWAGTRDRAPGYDISRWFMFEANAGPGFSGGPVVDAQGRLVGITFAYKDEGGKRVMYAYEMSRVQADLEALR